MKKAYIQLFFLFFFVYGFSQNIIVEKFKSQELAGEILEERIIKIYIPDSYKVDSTQTYPLAVVLDAEHLFDIYVANSRLFATRDKAPEQIVVGIMQNQKNERKLDCAVNFENSMLTETSSKFYKFIKNELLPNMENKYRLSPFKTIVGNTLTANFINYYLVEPQQIFNAYININPFFPDGLSSLFQGKIPILEPRTYYYLNTGKYNGEKRNKAIEKIHYILKMDVH